MLYLFNNCKSVKHIDLYGNGAFFDLYTNGRENDVAKELRPGDICWVASYSGGAPSNEVALTKYQFGRLRKVPSPDSPNGAVWVLEGKLIEREILPKATAAKHQTYSRLFDKRGHFKQVSFLRGV